MGTGCRWPHSSRKSMGGGFPEWTTPGPQVERPRAQLCSSLLSGLGHGKHDEAVGAGAPPVHQTHLHRACGDRRWGWGGPQRGLGAAPAAPRARCWAAARPGANASCRLCPQCWHPELACWPLRSPPAPGAPTWAHRSRSSGSLHHLYIRGLGSSCMRSGGVGTAGIRCMLQVQWEGRPWPGACVNRRRQHVCVWWWWVGVRGRRGGATCPHGSTGTDQLPASLVARQARPPPLQVAAGPQAGAIWQSARVTAGCPRPAPG